MRMILIDKRCSRAWAVVTCGIIAAGSARVDAGTTNNSRSVAAALGLNPKIKWAAVWGDHRTHGPPDRSQIPVLVPQYNPKYPYDPNDPTTSPLEPPHKRGGDAWMPDRDYQGQTGEQLFGEPYPALTDPKDTVGFGRAFNLPDHLPPTSGSAPVILVNLATDSRPPDMEAINATEAQPAQPSAKLATLVLVPAVTVASPAPATRPTVISSATAVQRTPSTQPVPKLKNVAQNDKLAAAFTVEDERHARSTLPTLAPPSSALQR